MDGKKYGDDEVIKKLMDGELSLSGVSTFVGDEAQASEIRRKYLERKYKIALQAITTTTIDHEDASKRNIENMIGATQRPLGFAEAVINGEHLKGLKPIFMSTTEGRLIAGVSRGLKAINAGGGATTTILDDKMTRSIIIETSGARESKQIMSFVESADGLKFIKAEFANHTKHGELIGVDCYTTGRNLFLVYNARTGAAMGMNMVTIASNNTTAKLVEQLNDKKKKRKSVDAEVSKSSIATTKKLLRVLSESGNLCTDKKPALKNVLVGRGVSIVAEALIPKDVVKDTLKTDPKEMARINYVKNYIGSSLAGSLAHNAQVANILNATFDAYGQDGAQIVDGVNALDDVEITDEGDLYISIYIPALEIGTYGGGTARETPKALLAASGVYGEGDDEGYTKRMLAELIATACLAGELNLLAAETSGELTKAHASIKRG
jgi:hydroxymethylglutaryl-CoA reductase (NADPH)